MHMFRFVHPFGIIVLIFGTSILGISCESAPERVVERIDPTEVINSEEARMLERQLDGLGCFAGNCINGIGSYAYNKKTIYIGSFESGLRNGKGTLEYANGDVYTGLFVNDLRSGMGKYHFSNGDYYDGEFIDGKRVGKGAYSFANGGVFEGEFANDGQTGEGLFYFNDNESMVCEIKNYSLLCLLGQNGAEPKDDTKTNIQDKKNLDLESQDDTP